MPTTIPSAIDHPKPQATHVELRRSVTPRAVLIGIALLPVNAYWVVCMELIRYSAHPSTISLFFNCVFALVVLTCINSLVARVAPQKALAQGELLLIYAMLGIGTAMCGHDFIQILVPMLAWVVYQSSESNHWAQLFSGSYPKWLTLTDHDAARDFFIGNSTLYTYAHLRAWALPVAVWGCFIFTLVFLLLCVNVLLRKRWTDQERLTYPLVRLPLEITSNASADSNGSTLVKSRIFWLGFAIAASIDIVNSLNYYFPAIPSILTPGNGASYYNLGQFVTTKPWNAIGWMPVSFYPFMIGLGMLMPLDFLFSMWFFYLFWKLQLVVTVACGWDADPRMPYSNYQSLGGYMLFCVSSIYVARSYFRDVFKCALGKETSLDDKDEPIRYKWALIGIVVALALLVGFSAMIGLAWWLAVLFFAIYLALAIAMTRMRAELGTPIHDLHQTGPDYCLPDLLGTRTMHHQDLGVFSLYYFFNRAYRCNPMPVQLEGFKMADVTGRRGELRGWFCVMLLATAVGILSAFWALLHLLYQFGALSKANLNAVNAFGSETWTRLASWQHQPKAGSPQVALAIVSGFLFAAFLQAMRVRFHWFPFHPLAYAVSSSFEINLVWMPLCIAWVIKGVILRYGGGGAGYHRSLPFFYGLILGQIVEGSLLNIWGIATGTATYQFWQ